MQDKKLTLEQKTVLLNKLTKDCQDFWLFIRSLWAKQPPDAHKSPITHCEKECTKVIVTKEADRAKLETHLIKNFKANEFIEIEREIKASAILQNNNHRPHIIKIRRGSYIHVKTDDGRLDEMEEEVRVLIFCWDEIPELDSDQFLNIERERMKKGSEAVISELEGEVENFLSGDE